MTKTSPKLVALFVGGITVASVFGLGIGAAVAQIPALLSPAGVSTDKGVPTEPMAVPSYPKNDSGQTYGSAAIADSPEHEPDLIQAVSDDGREGYVKKVDLDSATGTTAASSFKSPEDALKWQATEGAKDHLIPVYDVDGVTQIGTFTVVGTNTQDSLKSETPTN